MEIKNCSIYPRYEESLPKISRIPEFALFMYHRHGKSNRVKCLPHSNGQALSAKRVDREVDLACLIDRPVAVKINDKEPIVGRHPADVLSEPIAIQVEERVAVAEV